MKKVTLLSIMLCICSIAFSQEETEVQQAKKDLNPFRIGVKIGIPNVIDGNLEILTPLFGHRLAPFVDYTSFKYNDDEGEVKANYFEVGTNIYFKNTGKGFYGSISFSNLKLDALYTDAETIDGTVYEGTATGDVEIETLNFKLGVRLGGKFYFRAEVGYGAGDIPQEIKVTGVESGTGMVVVDYVDISDLPGMSEDGLFIGNIGFGIAF